MTDSIKEKLIRKLQVMASFLAGDKIEFRIPFDSWTDTDNPEWDWLHFEYRVKNKKTEGKSENEELYEDPMWDNGDMRKRAPEMKYKAPSKLERAIKSGKMSPILKIMLMATKMQQQKAKQ